MSRRSKLSVDLHITNSNAYRTTVHFNVSTGRARVTEYGPNGEPLFLSPELDTVALCEGILARLRAAAEQGEPK